MKAFSVRDMEIEAQRRLDPAVYDYFAGGADDEITVVANEAAFAAAVDEIAAVSGKFLNSLKTNAPPRNRADEAIKARERAALRFSR